MLVAFVPHLLCCFAVVFKLLGSRGMRNAPYSVAFLVPVLAMFNFFGACASHLKALSKHFLRKKWLTANYLRDKLYDLYAKTCLSIKRCRFNSSFGKEAIIIRSHRGFSCYLGA
jgi:hypothetical protein